MKSIYIIVPIMIASVLIISLYGVSIKKRELAHRRSLPMTQQTLPSGLMYEVINPGTSKKLSKGQRVYVHYTGWLNDNGQPGKKFDSSFDRNTPFDFTLGAGNVIRGWDEGVALMTIGSKFRFVIPPALGYGDRGVRNVIPSNATLIFDVEVLSAE